MTKEMTLIVEAVRAAIILLTAFGIAINAEQQAAIVLFAGALFALASAGLAVFNRSKVYSIDTTQKAADRAAATGIADIGIPPGGIPPVVPPGG